LNPHTLRCISAQGQIANALIERGDIRRDIAIAAAAANPYYGLQKQRRTYKQQQYPYYQQQQQPQYPYYQQPQQQQQPQYPVYQQQQQQQPMFYYNPRGRHRRQTIRGCPPGTQRNPRTGRCIKEGGDIYKAVYGVQVQPPRMPVQPQVQPQQQQQVRPQVPVRPPSEGKIALPIGSASPAPLNNPLSWMRQNCRNNRDPITGITFSSADTLALQEVLRLHDRTCTLAAPLDKKVAADHKSGTIATIPGDTSTPMTLDDFAALRDTMRRRNPAYKIPARKHQPPPTNWKLYIGSDNRSGPDFASVMFIDITKAIRDPQTGVQYPVNSVVVDLGFIPLKITGAICSPQVLAELIKRLNAQNRLLTPVGGGWKPVAGFPFKKSNWDPSNDGKERLNRLCRDLTRALSTPL